MFVLTSITMDVKFRDRMSQISKRVRYILEESEKLKEVLAERIAKRAEKAAEDAAAAEEIEAELEVSEAEPSGTEEEGSEATEDDSDELDEDDEANKPLADVVEEEPVADNEYSACWNCFCRRR